MRRNAYDETNYLNLVKIDKELYMLFKNINSVNNAIVQQIDSRNSDLSQMTILSLCEI